MIIAQYGISPAQMNHDIKKMEKFLAITLFLLILSYAIPRVCEMGYGQRGLKFRNSIIWQRNCKATDYCFEAVTSNIENMKPLIDYPWVRIAVHSNLFA